MGDDIFTPDEKRIIAMYRQPAASMRHAIRLSIQYLLGAGIFLGVAILEDEPLYALLTFAVFVLYVLIRLVNARRVSGVMPTIIAKYDERIRELEQATAGRTTGI